MGQFHLAQVNIAKRLGPMDDPIIQDFANNVDRINPLADHSEGFVWRLKDEDKDLGAQIFQDDQLLINLSVWESLESLFNYTYNSGHIEIFKRKKECFIKMKMVHLTFWFVPKGYEPTFQDSKNRLDYLIEHGDTPYSFTFKNKFTIADCLNYKPLL